MCFNRENFPTVQLIKGHYLFSDKKTIVGITVYFNGENFPAVQTKATIYFGLGLIFKVKTIAECKHLI